MPGQLRGAGKAARAKQPQTFLLQSSVVSVLTLSPFTRAQCPTESGLSFQKHCVLPAFHGQCIQREKKGKSCSGVRCKERLLPKYVVTGGFFAGEGVC